MERQKQNNKLGLAAKIASSLLLAATFGLLQGSNCADENIKKDTIDKNIGGSVEQDANKYLSLTFLPDPLDEFGSKQLDVMSSNNDGSLIYFSNDKRVKSTDKKYTVATLHVRDLDGKVTSIALSGGGKWTDAGKTTHLQDGFVDNIAAGPDGKMIVTVYSIGKETILGSDNNGGIALVKGLEVLNAWRNSKNHIDAVKYNNSFGPIAVTTNNWFAFVEGSEPSQAAYLGWDGTGKAKATTVSFKNDTVAVGNGNTLFVVSTGGVINKIDATDPSAIKATDENKLPINLEADENTKNNNINAIAVVGEYLIVGMGSIDDKTGGFGVYKQADGALVSKPEAGTSVKEISVGVNGRNALITTDKGLTFYHGGKAVKINNAKDALLITKEQGMVVAVKPSSKFDFTTANVAAQDKNGTWYVSTGNGTFAIKTEEINK